MTAIQQILNFLPRLEEGYSLELYTNKLYDAVLVSISPSSIEHHVNLDLSDITVTDMLQLEYYGIDVQFPCCPEPLADVYANTNSFDMQYIDTK